MELKKKIESYAKNTVGYLEASSKESFMVGVSVAFSKTEEHYEKTIEDLNWQIKQYKSRYEDARNDLKTLAEIINRYSE